MGWPGAANIVGEELSLSDGTVFILTDRSIPAKMIPLAKTKVLFIQQLVCINKAHGAAKD